MSGITPISMINYMYSLPEGKIGERKLTPETRAKLIALGVDVSNIRNEKEGKIKLREAQIERTGSSSSTEKELIKTDEVLDDAKKLAEKLNISVSENDTVDEIIDKIAEKIESLKSDAGEDFDKQSDVNYYERQLAMVETAHLSQINLSATMNLTANMNIAFHGLY